MHVRGSKLIGRQVEQVGVVHGLNGGSELSLNIPDVQLLGQDEVVRGVAVLFVVVVDDGVVGESFLVVEGLNAWGQGVELALQGGDLFFGALVLVPQDGGVLVLHRSLRALALEDEGVPGTSSGARIAGFRRSLRCTRMCLCCA